MEDRPNYGNARIAKCRAYDPTAEVVRTDNGCWVVTFGRETHLSVNARANKFYDKVNPALLDASTRALWEET